MLFDDTPVDLERAHAGGLPKSLAFCVQEETAYAKYRVPVPRGELHIPANDDYVAAERLQRQGDTPSHMSNLPTKVPRMQLCLLIFAVVRLLGLREVLVSANGKRSRSAFA